MLASAHRDVLETPTPDTEEGKARLLEELKNRGRAAVGHRSWMDAELLYQRALTVQDDAALHSNVSLCQFHMGMFDASRKEAQAAVDLDPMYVKGYWRLAQALAKLHRTDEAIQSIQDGLNLEPANKAFLKELAILEKQRAEEAKLMDTEPTEITEPAGPNPFEKINISNPPPAEKKAVEKKKKHQPSLTSSVETATTDGEFSKSDHVKGYKIVNGKKTSFFHNEMTEEVKELIGDIAPKRLEEAPAAESGTVAPGASAWNKAGTWEERDVTGWAKESLEQALLKTFFTFPALAPGALASITKASVDGTASYATVRGKKRYLYEFKLTVNWAVTKLPDDGVCLGSLIFPDVDGTCELGDGYDIADYIVKEGVPGVTPLLERFVKNGGLRDSLHTSIDDWVRLFKETY